MKTKLKTLVYTTFITIAFVLFSACNNDDYSTENPMRSTYKGGLMTYDDYIAEMARPLGSGTVLIQNNAGFLVQSPKDPDKGITISTNDDSPPYPITFYDTYGKPIKIIDRQDLEHNEQLYGNDLQYSIDGIHNNFYIPKLLYAETNTYYKLKKGTKITWNADERNEKGVVIWLTYKPTTQMIWDIMEKNQNYITEGWTVEDSGSYTITDIDLERLPDRAQIDLYLLRTNFTYNGLKKPGLIAYTLLFRELTLEK